MQKGTTVRWRLLAFGRKGRRPLVRGDCASRGEPQVPQKEQDKTPQRVTLSDSPRGHLIYLAYMRLKNEATLDGVFLPRILSEKRQPLAPKFCVAHIKK